MPTCDARQALPNGLANDKRVFSTNLAIPSLICARLPRSDDGEVVVFRQQKKRCAYRLAFDDKRHSTTTLFAAQDVLEGKVIGRCMQRHLHQEFIIRFLNAVEAQV